MQRNDLHRLTSNTLIQESLQHLQKHSISVVDCVYNNVLLDCADENNVKLYQQISCSDMHFDCFNDKELQYQLSLKHIKASNYNDALLPLTLWERYLNGARTGSYVTGHQMLNHALLEHAMRHDWLGCHHLVDTMKALDLRPDTTYLWVMQSRLLNLRQKIYEPKPAEELSQLFVHMLQSGFVVPAAIWGQLFKYYGMMGFLKRTERLALMLVHWYGRPETKVLSRDSAMLFFRPLRLRAIVEWGFKSIVGRGQLQWSTLKALSGYKYGYSLSGWERGIRLVANLRTLGIPVANSDIRKAVVTRLLILYGGKSVKMENVIARKMNKVPLWRMVSEIQQIWPGLLQVPNEYAGREDASDLMLAHLETEGRSRRALRYQRKIGRRIARGVHRERWWKHAGPRGKRTWRRH